MSYEGDIEFLCPNGHHWETHDHSYSSAAEWKEASTCAFCKLPAALSHSIDYTNGIDDPDPEFRTQPAPLIEAGFDDNWKTDHYGTRYAEKVRKYVPKNPSNWTTCPDYTKV